MINGLDIKETLLELGEYKHSYGKVLVVEKLCKNVYVYSTENKNFGLVMTDGKILMPPICDSFKMLDESLVLLSQNNLFGVFDLKQNRYLVPCIHDYVELNIFENKVEYVDLYKGINSYTFGVNASKGSYFLNPHLSKYMLSLLEKKPEMFFSLKSDYFREDGKFNFHNVELCKKRMAVGVKNITDKMILQGQSGDKVNSVVDEFYGKVERKIRKEKEEVGKNKEISD